MTEIEQAGDALLRAEVSADHDHFEKAAVEVVYAQAQATLSIAKSLDYLCGRLSDLPVNTVADAIYHLAEILAHKR